MDDLDQIKQLAGITQNVGRLQEYKGQGTVATEGSNMSVTANEKIQYQKEHEIWMRPTQYYASYNADELVDRRGWIQKISGKTQHPTVQAKNVAVQKQAAQYKELDDLL